MTYEDDRIEREEGGGSFLMGLLAGTVLGAGLGMLFAPKAGSELRNQLSETANKLQHASKEGYQQASEKVTRIVDRSREAYEQARGTASEKARELTDQTRQAYEQGREAVARASEELRGMGAETSRPGSEETRGAGAGDAASTGAGTTSGPLGTNSEARKSGRWNS